VVTLPFVAFFVLGSAGEKVAALRSAEKVVCTGFIPSVAVRCLDRHLEQFPRVVAAICRRVVVFRIRIALRLELWTNMLINNGCTRSSRISPVVASCWLALVKARFFDKVPLALRRQWSTPVPVVFLAVCLLDGLGTSNRGGLTASVVFVRGTFGQFSRSWSFTVVVVEVAHVRMFGSEVHKRIEGFDSLRVWVGARVPPHDCGGQTQRMGGGSRGKRVVDRVCVCACVRGRGNKAKQFQVNGEIKSEAQLLYQGMFFYM